MKKYICKICGFVTEDKSQPHPCGRVEAIIHDHNVSPMPRSAIDSLVRKIVHHVKNEIATSIEKHPDEMNKIHPKMLVTLTITNVILNMFFEAFDETASMKEMREAFSSLLEDLCEMSMNGLNAVLASKADNKTMN